MPWKRPNSNDIWQAENGLLRVFVGKFYISEVQQDQRIGPGVGDFLNLFECGGCPCGIVGGDYGNDARLSVGDLKHCLTGKIAFQPLHSFYFAAADAGIGGDHLEAWTGHDQILAVPHIGAADAVDAIIAAIGDDDL